MRKELTHIYTSYTRVVGQQLKRIKIMDNTLTEYDKEKSKSVAAEAYIRGTLRGGWYNPKSKTFMFTGSDSVIKTDDFRELKLLEAAA